MINTSTDVPDGRAGRSAATRLALMRAAETLFAENGILKVSVKDILALAKQNNASALQYHFGDLQGLIDAIRETRGQEIKAKRTELLERLLTQTPTPTLRDTCKLLAGPAFELACADKGFQNAIKAFGNEIALTEGQAGARTIARDSLGTKQTIDLVRRHVEELDEGIFFLRLDGAVRFLSASLVSHALQPNAFSGATADLFFNNLIDCLSGLLSAPVSAATQSIQTSNSK